MSTEEWMTKRELAAKLKVSERTIVRLRLPAWKVGGQNRYYMSEVERALGGGSVSGDNVVELRPRPKGRAA